MDDLQAFYQLIRGTLQAIGLLCAGIVLPFLIPEKIRQRVIDWTVTGFRRKRQDSRWSKKRNRAPTDPVTR